MTRKREKRNRKNRSPDPPELNRPQKLGSAKNQNVKIKEPKCSTKKRDIGKKGSKSTVEPCEKDNGKLPGRSGSSLKKRKCKKEVKTTSPGNIKKNKKKDYKKTCDKIKKKAKTEVNSVTSSESNIKSCSPSFMNLDGRRPEVDTTNVGCHPQDIAINNVPYQLRSISTFDINSNGKKKNTNEVPVTLDKNQNLTRRGKRKCEEGSKAPLCIDVFQSLTPQCNENNFVNTQFSHITNDFSNFQVVSSGTTSTDDQPCSDKSLTKPKSVFEQVNKLCAPCADLKISNVQPKARNSWDRKMSETKTLFLKGWVSYYDMSNLDWETIHDEKNDFWIVNGEEALENIISSKTTRNRSIERDETVVTERQSGNIARGEKAEAAALNMQTQGKQCTKPKFSNVIQGPAMREKSKNGPIYLPLEKYITENGSNNSRTTVPHIFTSMNGTNQKTHIRMVNNSSANTDKRKIGFAVDAVDNSNTNNELRPCFSTSKDATTEPLVKWKANYDFPPYYEPIFDSNSTEKSLNTDVLAKRHQNKSKEYSNSPTPKKCTNDILPMTDMLSNSRSDTNVCNERNNKLTTKKKKSSKEKKRKTENPSSIPEEPVMQEIYINSPLPSIDADSYSTQCINADPSDTFFPTIETFSDSDDDFVAHFWEKKYADQLSSSKRSYYETLPMSPASPPETCFVQQHAVCDDFPKKSFFENERFPPNHTRTNEEMSRSEVQYILSAFNDKYLTGSNSSVNCVEGNSVTPFIPEREKRSSSCEEMSNSIQGMNSAYTSDCHCALISTSIPKEKIFNRIPRKRTAHTLPHKSHEYAKQNDQTKTKLKHSTSSPHEMHKFVEACEYSAGYINNFSTKEELMTPVYKIYQRQNENKGIKSNGGSSINYVNMVKKSDFPNGESATSNKTSLPLFLRPSIYCSEKNVFSDSLSVKNQYEYGNNENIVKELCCTDGQNSDASDSSSETFKFDPENETDPYAPVFIKPSVTITRCKKGPTPRKPTKEELFRDPNFIFDLDWNNNTDTTPMHWAAFRGNTNIVSNLIEEGARLNVQDKCGRTPLHIAVMQGHTGCVETLLRAYANPCIVDRESLTPLDMAKLLQKTDIVNILYRYVKN